MIRRPSRQSVIPSILPRAVAVVLATTGLLALAALLGICPAQATARRLANSDPRPGLAAGDTSAVQDAWTHAQQVIANLRASPPAEPVVCLLGGSSARECTISDEEWAAQVQALGVAAITYNLGSSSRTFAQDVALMEALPSGRLDMIVFIGINVGRFTFAKTSASITLPTPVFPLPPWGRLLFMDQILPVSEKRALVTAWMAKRYPIFQADYTTARMMLERLIIVCKARGLYPVLVDLPRDMAIIGHALDAPISRYRNTCRALSVKYSIPYLGGFVGAANLANDGFYDLWHVRELGRVKWQRILSAKTAELLQLYGLGSEGSGVAR